MFNKILSTKDSDKSNVQWSVVIYGNQKEVLPLLEDWSLQDRYKQGLLWSQGNGDHNISSLVVYDVYELGKVITAIENCRQNGSNLQYEITCSVKRPDGSVVEDLVLTEGGSWRKVT